MAVQTPTATDITARLNALKARAEKGKQERTRAELQLEQIAKEEAKLLEELAALGVKPEELDAEISRCTKQIEQLLAEAEAALAGVPA